MRLPPLSQFSLASIVITLGLVTGCAKTDFSGQTAGTQSPATNSGSGPTAPVASSIASAPATVAAGGTNTATNPGAVTTPGSTILGMPATGIVGTPAAGIPCGSAGMTQATLLTPTLQNGTPGNYLEYQLSLTDCAGNQQNLTADAIQFDVDAESQVGTVVPLGYTVRDTAHQISGTLMLIQGSDLFNKTGPDFFHYQTDQAVNFATAETSVILHIDLEGQEVYPFPSASITSPNQLQTFLRFGNATPVSVVCGLIGSNNQYGNLP